jgi:uncharacterized protein (UPF0276 family)
MNAVRVGYMLMPRLEDLEQLAELIEQEVDYYSVAPETLWRVDSTGAWIPNGYHARFTELKTRTGRPFVAHGVGLSVGTLDPRDRPRQLQWLERIRADQAVFEFEWYSDHLGATIVGGDVQTLPLPLPMDAPVAAACRARLAELQTIVPDVGLENSAVYHYFGDPLDEPAFLNEILSASRMHQVLDLHNVWTIALNTGLDPRAYLERIELANVIEMHVSGGAWTDPLWFPGERALRLDSHDGAVPEEVWALLEAYAPRCAQLRGITLERMEGTLQPGDEQRLRGELARIRAVAARCGGKRAVLASGASPDGAAPADLSSATAGTERGTATGSACAQRPGLDAPTEAELAPYLAFELALARALRSRDAYAALAREIDRFSELTRAQARRWYAAIDARGFALSALFADRLRFERLMQGSNEALAWFERDPAGFATAFRRYRNAIAPSELHPWGERRLFDAWCATDASATESSVAQSSADRS